jgi:hypothetical protein
VAEQDPFLSSVDSTIVRIFRTRPAIHSPTSPTQAVLEKVVCKASFVKRVLVFYTARAHDTKRFPSHARAQTKNPKCIHLNLSRNASLGVGNLDTELLGTGDNVDSLSG